MTEMYHTLNAICVDDLGFAVDIFPSVQFNPYLKDRVIKEIITPKYQAEVPKGLFKRVVLR